jgi:hypothetical protein
MGANAIISFLDGQIINNQKHAFTFIGNSKSGKSTFINSVIGMPIQQYKRPEFGTDETKYRYDKNMEICMWELTSELQNDDELIDIFNETSYVVILINNKKLNKKVCRYIKMITEQKINFIFAKLIDFNAEEHIEKTGDIEIVYTHIRSGTNTPLLLKKMIELANETKIVNPTD